MATAAPAQNQAQAALTAVQTPTEQPGFLDQIGFAARAAEHNFFKPLHGAAQFVENGLAKGAALLPDNPVSRKIISDNTNDNQALAQWEHDYQASVPNGWGANIGATTGAVAPFLLGAIPNGLKAIGTNVAERIFPTAEGMAPSIVNRAVSGATQGAVVGAAQPVTNAPTGPSTLSDLIAPQPQEPFDYWGQKAKDIETGAAFGSAMPVLAGAANGAWQAGKGAVINSPILNPTGYAATNIARQLGPTAPTVAGNLAAAPQYVPGSIPTAAQAGGSPDLVMMEKALANQNPDFAKALQVRANANNAARLQAVGNVAQTPEALQAAIDSRTAVTTPMRQFTVDNGNPVPVAGVNSALSSVANGPLGVQPTIGPAARALQSEVGGFTNVTPPNTLTNTPGSVTAAPSMLDALRQNVNKYLAKNEPNGFVGTQEQAAMAPVKSAIIDAINDANPGHSLPQGGWGQGLPQAGPTAPSYRDYLAEFAKRSVPVNTMELGQQLQKPLLENGMNSAGDAQLALAGYRSKLAAALRNSDYAIDPQAQAGLEGVQNDLQRATISNSVRTGGSDTAYNQGAGSAFLRALGAGNDSDIGKMATAGGATLLATGSPQVAGAAAFGAKKAGGWVANRVGSSMSDLLLDPQALAASLQKASQPASTTVPALLTGFGGKLTPAMAAALALKLQQQDAPEVVQGTQQGAYQH